MALTPKESRTLDEVKQKLARALADVNAGRITTKECNAISREADQEMKKIDERINGKRR